MLFNKLSKTVSIPPTAMCICVINIFFCYLFAFYNLYDIFNNLNNHTTPFLIKKLIVNLYYTKNFNLIKNLFKLKMFI